jgi:trimeric autotransporter adhesin
VTNPQRTSDPTTGLFSAATGKVSVSISGTDVADYSSTGETLLTSTSLGTGLTVNGQVWATSFTPTSDQRLKKNIRTLDDALERIGKLRGVSFDWRTPGEREIGRDLTLPTDEHQLGVIAQEVEEVFPEAVGTGNNGVKNVNYNSLVGPLIEAVKELKRRNEKQQQEIDDLSVRLSNLGAAAGPPAPASGRPSGFPTGRNGSH